MMHGHEKSDPAIVVMKPANKAEGPPAARPAGEKHAAESVERRAGAEGFHSLEGNMCGTATRGAVALPGSKATSRAKGSHRNLGDLVSGRRGCVGADCGGPHREGEGP